MGQVGRQPASWSKSRKLKSRLSYSSRSPGPKVDQSIEMRARFVNVFCKSERWKYKCLSSVLKMCDCTLLVLKEWLFDIDESRSNETNWAGKVEWNLFRCLTNPKERVSKERKIKTFRRISCNMYFSEYLFVWTEDGYHYQKCIYIGLSYDFDFFPSRGIP